jgi:hypothetical protein
MSLIAAKCGVQLISAGVATADKLVSQSGTTKA